MVEIVLAQADVASDPSEAPRAVTSAPAAEPAEAAPKADTSEKTKKKDAEEDDEDELKGIKPNSGNGADLDRYSWTQTLSDVTVTVPVPAGTKGRDVAVHIAKSSLKVGLKGAEPIVAGELHEAVLPDDCMWSIIDGRAIEITLQKARCVSAAALLCPRSIRPVAPLFTPAATGVSVPCNRPP